MRKSKFLKRKAKIQSIAATKVKWDTDALDDGQGNVDWYDLSYYYEHAYDNVYADMIKLGWYHEPVGCGHEGCCPQTNTVTQHGWDGSYNA